jgi:hypothetical protein
MFNIGLIVFIMATLSTLLTIGLCVEYECKHTKAVITSFLVLEGLAFVFFLYTIFRG